MTTPKYYCPECFEYIGNSHRAACSRYPANQAKRQTLAQKLSPCALCGGNLLTPDTSKWEEEANSANNNMHLITLHPKFLLDLLHSLDAARKENEDLKNRFEEAIKKLKG
jgi:hypothetical protein